MGLFGDVADAVGSLAGGVLGLVGNSQKNAANAAMSEQNYQAQKEFAQNGIRWKVADAKAAGLHPLAALGAMTNSYQPAQTMFESPDYSFLGDMGQGIGRAVDAKRTQKERDRQQDFQDTVNSLRLDSLRLQNEYTQAQIDSTKQDMVMQLARSAEMAARTQQQVPAMPALGRGGTKDAFPTGDVQPEISKVPTSVRGDPTTQAGTPPDARAYLSPFGRVLLPTQDAADSIDSAFGAGIHWSIRNSLLPFLANYLPIEDERRRPGEAYNPFTGTYYKGRRFRDFFGY